MNNKSSKPFITTKQIAITAILLAICIASQFLKSLSVYITGPIINMCLVLAVLTAGLPSAILLSIITPVTAFLIAASPIMNAIPGIIPLIMAGNAVLAVCTEFLVKKELLTKKQFITVRSVLGAVASAVAKGAFMGLTISLWLIPTFLSPESKLYGKMPVFQTTFSLTQLITAGIGFVYVFIVWLPLRKSFLSAKSE